MLWFLVLGSSTLRPEDNPYEILGVNKRSSQTDIKAAYKKLTMKYHPDISHDKNTEVLWMAVNDAYQLLSNPDRKAFYDLTGQMIDELPTVNDMTNFQFVGKHIGPDGKLQTPLLIESNFSKFVKENADTLFYVYASENCDYCHQFLELFEEFHDNFKTIVRCGRIDLASNGTNLAQQLGADKIPSFVYFHKTQNHTIVKPADKLITTIMGLAEFISDQWPTLLKLIEPQKFDDFINFDDTTPHVIEITRSPTPSMIYKRMASLFRDSSLFGHYVDSDFAISKKYNITQYPTILVFRNVGLNPHQFQPSKKIGEEVDEWATPVYFELHPFSLGRFCSEVCFVRIGKANEDDLEILNHINVTTGYMDANAKENIKLNVTEGDWLILSPSTAQYANFGHRELNPDMFTSMAKMLQDEEINMTTLPSKWQPPIRYHHLWKETKRMFTYYREEMKMLIEIVITVILLLIGLIVFCVWCCKRDFCAEPHKTNKTNVGTVKSKKKNWAKK